MQYHVKKCKDGKFAVVESKSMQELAILCNLDETMQLCAKLNRVMKGCE